MAPIFCTYSCESCLNLISNYQTSKTSDSVCYHWNVAIHKSVDSSNALNGLENYSSHVSITVRVNNFQSIFFQGLYALMQSFIFAGPCEFLMGISSERIA